MQVNIAKPSMVFVYSNKENKFTELIKHSGLDDSFACIIGGDGTFLRALKAFEYGKVPKILAFNSGTVGFLLPLKVENFNDVIRKAKENMLKRVKRSRVFIKTHTRLFVNELVLRSSSFRLNTFEIKINDFKFTLKACELVVATQTGSTGYNASLGGPIVLSDCIVLNCTGPNRCNFKPIVLPIAAKISISVSGCFGYCDGEEISGEYFEISEGDSYSVLVDDSYGEYQEIESILYTTVSE